MFDQRPPPPSATSMDGRIEEREDGMAKVGGEAKCYLIAEIMLNLNRKPVAPAGEVSFPNGAWLQALHMPVKFVTYC